MSNSIPTTQNDPAQLTLLRAQRFLYGEAKQLLALQVLLTVGLPVGGALGTFADPGLRAYVAFTALIIALLDAAVIDRAQKCLRLVAAKIQEQFDCAVLELPWDGPRLGSPPTPESIREADKRHLGGNEDTTLKNWYPPVVGSIPMHLGRIVCQRANVWWDSELRRRFSHWVLGVVVGLAIVLTILGLVRDWSLEQLVLVALAPLSPVTLWGIREWYRQRDAATTLDRLNSDVESLWSDAASGALTPAECTTRSRLLQSAIHDHRKSSPLIVDWIYARLRTDFEDRMKYAADEFVRQAIQPKS